MKGELFILSSPAGGGKTTIANLLIKEIPNLKRVITCTTRKPRTGEKDGVDYYFLTEDEFKKRIEEGKFLEYAVVHGNYYGTPKEEVEKELSKGFDLLLVIDVQGMLQIKSKKSDVVSIFLLPPSLDELIKRMENRGDSPEEIKKRIETAKKEIPQYKRYDYVVVNDVLEKAKNDVKCIIISHRHKTERFSLKLIKDEKLKRLLKDEWND
ncbi:guanylate kinase [Persephonella atlantica]|uniref:Guanylate kinase n=1 Tax=Persephonella atlantica TaxID=2699429 RepID=A0ABS1GGX3_9AQUI|nr:guanylate kinase [Persephonella atlantica]MBK3332183.1 guanylate kinase [Persephonella atlantica]